MKRARVVAVGRGSAGGPKRRDVARVFSFVRFCAPLWIYGDNEAMSERVSISVNASKRKTARGFGGGEKKQGKTVVVCWSSTAQNALTDVVRT